MGVGIKMQSNLNTLADADFTPMGGSFAPVSEQNGEEM